MKFPRLITLLAAVVSVTADAKIVSGVEVPDTLAIQQTELQLNGAGVRSKFFMDLYVGSLFTSLPSTEAASLIRGDQPSAIRLNITSSMITKEKLADALNEGFNNATDGNTTPIDSSINQFVEMTFANDISEGDQFTLVSAPEIGIYSYKNGEMLVLVEGDAFRRALLSVWLGDKPTDKSLKKAMLSQ
ncbi:chalcone isomerase family protein [Vibrio barjaei]|jgi:hypothetical protein|uniref:Chalcone isomerase family protein n=1 Tax=Vibrio barjaei TaxID=1676683 RepID=A0ABW7IPP0_9VIBR|nr:chalcone isomerase family protein [Vibrio barjaei]OIN26786.1 chalcone isomerase [Vibrio barjaei]